MRSFTNLMNAAYFFENAILVHPTRKKDAFWFVMKPLAVLDIDSTYVPQFLVETISLRDEIPTNIQGILDVTSGGSKTLERSSPEGLDVDTILSICALKRKGMYH
jgi:hypothetical protein